jgi:hypothetical protein
MHPDVIFRVLGDGAVLVNLASNEVMEFNSTGAAIWEHLSRGASIDDVIPQLMETFDVDRTTAERDVETFLSELTSRGLIT